MSNKTDDIYYSSSNIPVIAEVAFCVEVDTIQVYVGYNCRGFTEEMVFRLLSILSSWKGRYNIQTITVLQLTGRRSTYNVPVDTYNFIVCQFNQHLKRELKSHSTIIYLNLRNMKNCISNIYMDGVHFNAEGNLRYYRNVSGAIINAIRSV
jgi:hypothetical protein